MATISSQLLYLANYPTTWKSVLSEKTKLGSGSTTMVSVSKDGHFQKHSTVEMGVALTLLHT